MVPTRDSSQRGASPQLDYCIASDATIAGRLKWLAIRKELEFNRVCSLSQMERGTQGDTDGRRSSTHREQRRTRKRRTNKQVKDVHSQGGKKREGDEKSESHYQVMGSTKEEQGAKWNKNGGGRKTDLPMMKGNGCGGAKKLEKVDQG